MSSAIYLWFLRFCDELAPGIAVSGRVASMHLVNGVSKLETKSAGPTAGAQRG